MLTEFMLTYTPRQIRYAIEDESAYLKSVYEFRHRVAAMLSMRAANAARLGHTEWAKEYRLASLRAARDSEFA